MTENPTIEKNAVPNQTVTTDLSREIEQASERLPDEIIKAVRVFDDYYRCNWWVRDKSPHAFWLNSGTIRRSRLVRVTKTSSGLLFQDAPTPTAL